MTNKISRMISLLAISVLTVLLFFGNVFGQGPDSDPVAPKRGTVPGASYSISDIENINLTNGNLMLNMSLVSLPKGRGGLSASLGLSYNSKLYDSSVEELPDMSNSTNGVDCPLDGGNCPPSYQNILVDSPSAGWRPISSLDYQVVVVNRLANGDHIECAPGANLQKMAYIWKVKLVAPDGSEKELRPLGYTDYFQDGYFNIAPTGYQHWASISTVGTGNYACTSGSTLVTTSPMVYYTTDGSFIRYSAGVIYFPDGSRLQNGRLTDRYDNWVENTTFNYCGVTATGISDQFGRKIFTTQGSQPNETYYYQTGFDGSVLRWTVRRKEIFARKGYRTTGVAGYRYRGGTSNQQVVMSFYVVDEIVLPTQLGGQTYEFGYNGSDIEPAPNQITTGWGEVSSVTLPSGARTEYEYKWDGTPVLTPKTTDILANSIKKKTLIYNEEYDGGTTSRSEIWMYTIGNTGSSVSSPDGSLMTQSHGNVAQQNMFNGLVFKIEDSNGTKTEKLWDFNRPLGAGAGSQINPFVKAEFTSFKDSSGNYSLTAVKEFAQDKNGSTTLVKEYDFVPYSTVPRDSYGQVTGVPSGVLPSRITKTDYYNATPDSSDTAVNTANCYWNSTNVRNVVAATEIQNGTNQIFSRTEIEYDNPSTTANPTQTRVWDSTKGAYSNPLTTANSISTTAVYDQYGNPTLATDAKGNQTQITYGAVNGFTGLYPTQTISAYQTLIARTSTAAYDFYTGLATTVTDVDNNVSVATEYDALGRPTKVRSAAGTALESWTQTTYDDINRRVTVKSDIDAIGDARKVAIQHFDQLGRVRLARTLEDAATQSATNETDGIKVQTRYKASGVRTFDATKMCSSQLVSNPYRASTSSGASSEETMGWTLTQTQADGKHSEVETFGGAALPKPFVTSGFNTNSTGAVKTDIDSNAATVTDQAGKKRRSITNGLGQLIRVDEPDGNGNLGSMSAPIQPTSYGYNALGNLVKVAQGQQNRYFLYDSLSRLIRVRQPEQTPNSTLSLNDPVTGNADWTIGSSYDGNGNILTTTDANNVVINYSYDALNRSLTRIYHDGTPMVTNQYDNPSVPFSKGRLTQVSNSVSTDKVTQFDPLGRPVSQQQIADGQTYTSSYQYNLAGALTQETYPSGRVVKNEYDASGDISRIFGQANSNATTKTYATGISYTPSGAIEKLKLGNGRWESAKFNSRLQVTELALGTSVGNGGLWTLNYEYGELQTNNAIDASKNSGNIARQTMNFNGLTNPLVQSYKYDSVNRIVEAKETANGTQNWIQNWTYDIYGNRISFTQNIAGNTTANNPTVDAYTNRFVTTGTNFQYDLNGNLVRDLENRQFTFSGDNKQTVVRDASNNVIGQYFYDGGGKRVKKVTNTETTIFVYSLGKLVAEYSTQLSQTPSTNYMTTDHLNSPRIITDQLGQVKSRRDFLPFGEDLYAGVGARTVENKYGSGSDDIRQKFTGYQKDSETALDFAEARMYENRFGRFTATDPIMIKKDRLVDPQRLNRYIYVRNNPLKHIDPDGKDIVISGKSEEEARKQFDVYLKGLTAEDRKAVQFQVGNGKNGYAKGAFYILVDSKHKSDSENFQAIQKVANNRSELVRATALKNGDTYTIRYYSGDVKKPVLTPVSGKFANDFDGYTLYQNRGKNNGGMYSRGAFNEMLIKADQTDSELASTFFHELRAHVITSDFGRDPSKGDHSQGCATGWNQCKPTSEADVAGKAAEKEASKNAQEKP